MEWLSDPLLPLVGAYLVINVIAMMMFLVDKLRARKGGRRISEKNLLLAALFGPFGALASMRMFRHKTRKTLFLLVPIFAVLHLALLLFLFY